MKIFVIIFVLSICFLTYLIFLCYLSIKKREYLAPFLAGSCTFFIFQILTRIPLLNWLQTQPKIILFEMANPFLWMLMVALSAALFEEGGRWLIIHFFLKKHTRATDGFFFGIGHGCFEAISLISPSYLLALFMPSSPIWNTAYSLIFLAGIERIFSIMFHIGASVMVTKSVRDKKSIWLFVAIALHTLLNSIVGFLQILHVSIFLTELFVVIIGTMLFIYAILSVKKEHKTERKNFL